MIATMQDAQQRSPTQVAFEIQIYGLMAIAVYEYHVNNDANGTANGLKHTWFAQCDLYIGSESFLTEHRHVGRSNDTWVSQMILFK